MADRLAWCLAENREDFWPGIYETINKSQIITKDQLQQLVREVQSQVEQLADALHLPEFTTDNYELLTLHVLERLSQLTEQQILQSMRSMQLRPLDKMEEEVRALHDAVKNRDFDQSVRNLQSSSSQPTSNVTPKRDTVRSDS